jgi:DNA-directed RNA polymerase specialized sigma24 family protein
MPNPHHGPREPPHNANHRCIPNQTNGELESVIATLWTLPEIDRAAVLLRAEEGMAYKEIGVALGIFTVSARARVHRARLRLAQARRIGGSTATEKQ